MNRKRLRDIDHGWAWFVMGAAFVEQMLIGMLQYIYGVIQVVLLETFQQGLVETTWILSIASGLLFLPGPLVGILTNVTNCRTTMVIGSTLIFVGLTSSAFVTNQRHLYLTFSVLAGLGTGIVYSPSLVVLGFYFDKHLNLATGIALTGSGLGMMVGPVLISYIAEMYGCRGMFLLIAGMMANIFVSSLICSPSDIERGLSSGKHEMFSSERSRPKTTAVKEEVSCYVRLLRNACDGEIFSLPMMTFCSSVFLWSITMPIVYLYFPLFAVEHGGTVYQSSLMFTVMGVCNVISKNLAGIGVNYGTIDKYLLYFGSFSLMGILTIVFPFLPNTFTVSMLYAAVFGICSGGPYVVLTTITKDIAGLRHLAVAYGVQLFVSGVGYMLGPPVAGVLVETSGSHSWGFVLAGSTSLLSSFLGMMLRICHKPHDAELEREVDPTLASSEQLRLGGMGRVASLADSEATSSGIVRTDVKSIASQDRNRPTHMQYVCQSFLDNQTTPMMKNSSDVETDNEAVSDSQLPPASCASVCLILDG